ncbi:MAG: DNA-binding protein [Candidatus Micrarchaeota archaeon]|nr:DNA-binding protein [Candidatus Micrarchaeota archaeon]
MKISDLKAGASNVTIQAKVSQKDDPREVVTKYGKRLSVANIVLQDDSGTIQMSLWGNDISSVNVGDTIEVSNGYVSEFRGAPQLSAGKFGKIKVLERGSGGSVKEEEADESMAEMPEDE